MKTMRLLTALGLAALAATACDDATTSARPEVPADAEPAPALPDAEIDAQPSPPPDAGPPLIDAEVDAGPDDDATAEDDGGEITDKDAGTPAGPVVGWIEVELDPRLGLYGVEETPVASARVFDRHGAPLEGVELDWRVEPPRTAAIDDTGLVTFLGEGPGTVLACAGEDVCGRAHFHVDAGPPKLTVTEPERGAALGGDRSESITVRGTATDTGGVVTVRINGVRVDVDPEGAFTLDVPARFGINHLEVTADDGVRLPAVRVTRDVLWAPRYLPVTPDGADVSDAARLWLGQPLLDRDEPVEIPEAAGQLVLQDLAGLLGAVLGAADADALLGDVAAAGLTVEGLDLGQPEVDLYVVPEGLELFLRMGRLHLDVSGSFDFEGTSLDLTGGLDASLAAFARLSFDVNAQQGLAITMDDSGVVLESLEGRFEDPRAQALIDTLGSRLRGTVETLASGLVVEIIRDQLPALVQTGLDGLIGSLENIPIHLDVGLEGAPVIDLGLGLLPEEAQRHRRTGLALALAARLRQPMPTEAPAAVPGVPAISRGEPPQDTHVALGLAVRLELLNALLHEVWRTGLLQISPSLPEDLAGLLQSVRLDARLPPVVAPAPPGSEMPLEAQLGDVRVFVTGPAGGEPDELVLTMRAGISLEMDENGALGLVSADMPQIEAELLRAAGARPVLPADLLEAIFVAAVWPGVRDALAGGLNLAIPPVAVDAESFAGVAPRVQAVTLRPAFDARPVVFDGWLLLEGGLETVLDLGP